MKDIADEIMSLLEKDTEVESKTTSVVDEVVEEVTEVRPELVATEWEQDPDNPLLASRRVPFSKKFWTPKHVPDHYVWEFSGYDSAPEPELYVPPKKEFEQLSLALELRAKVNIVGPTGAGKTLMYEYYAASTGRPLLRIEHNQDLDKAMVFGQVHINTDPVTGAQITDFVPGVLPRSMAVPTLVILDELSRSTGFANMIYQRVLDRWELFMPEMKDAGAAAIKPHPQWLICASDNTKGNGDDMDMYSASNIQDAAFINRWDMVIEQDYLNQSQELELVKKMANKMRTTDMQALVKFSGLIHAGFKKGEITTAFSPRNLSMICRLFNAGVPLKDAVHMNYTSRVAKSEASDVQECVRASFGSK